MKIWIAKDYEKMSVFAATIVARQIKKKPDSVLGLATGGTPLGMYRELVRMVQAGEISFKRVRTFNLDEYIGLPKDHPQSYHTYMYEHLFSKVDIPAENVHLPSADSLDPYKQLEQCKAYDQAIEEAGGIDLQILGIGPNGHIGFNEPASSLEVGTHIVELKPETRKANARFFNSMDEVPTHAITMGVGSILKSRAILLLANGKNKAEVIAQAFAGDVNTHLPASLLQVHPNVIIIVDEEAACLIDDDKRKTLQLHHV